MGQARDEHPDEALVRVVQILGQAEATAGSVSQLGRLDRRTSEDRRITDVATFKPFNGAVALVLLATLAARPRYRKDAE